MMMTKIGLFDCLANNVHFSRHKWPFLAQQKYNSDKGTKACMVVSTLSFRAEGCQFDPQFGL